MTTYIIILIIGGLAKAIMWKVQFHMIVPSWAKAHDEQEWKAMKFISPLAVEWWHSGISHRNKYRRRYHEMGRAYVGSTTWLVWLTDAFHFFQLIYETSWQLILALAIAPEVPVESALIWRVLDLVFLIKFIHSGSFELTFKYLLEMKFESIKNYLKTMFAEAPVLLSIIAILVGGIMLLGVNEVLGPVAGPYVVTGLMLSTWLLAVYMTSVRHLIKKQKELTYARMYRVNNPDPFTLKWEERLIAEINHLDNYFIAIVKQYPNLTIMGSLVTVSIIAQFWARPGNVAELISGIFFAAAWLLGIFLIFRAKYHDDTPPEFREE